MNSVNFFGSSLVPVDNERYTPIHWKSKCHLAIEECEGYENGPIWNPSSTDSSDSESDTRFTIRFVSKIENADNMNHLDHIEDYSIGSDSQSKGTVSTDTSSSEYDYQSETKAKAYPESPDADSDDPVNHTTSLFRLSSNYPQFQSYKARFRNCHTFAQYILGVEPDSEYKAYRLKVADFPGKFNQAKSKIVYEKTYEQLSQIVANTVDIEVGLKNAPSQLRPHMKELLDFVKRDFLDHIDVEAGKVTGSKSDDSEKFGTLLCTFFTKYEVKEALIYNVCHFEEWSYDFMSLLNDNISGLTDDSILPHIILIPYNPSFSPTGHSAIAAWDLKRGSLCSFGGGPLVGVGGSATGNGGVGLSRKSSRCGSASCSRSDCSTVGCSSNYCTTGCEFKFTSPDLNSTYAKNVEAFSSQENWYGPETIEYGLSLRLSYRKDIDVMSNLNYRAMRLIEDIYRNMVVTIVTETWSKKNFEKQLEMQQALKKPSVPIQWKGSEDHDSEIVDEASSKVKSSIDRSTTTDSEVQQERVSRCARFLSSRTLNISCARRKKQTNPVELQNSESDVITTAVPAFVTQGQDIDLDALKRQFKWKDFSLNNDIKKVCESHPECVGFVVKRDMKVDVGKSLGSILEIKMKRKGTGFNPDSITESANSISKQQSNNWQYYYIPDRVVVMQSQKIEVLPPKSYNSIIESYKAGLEIV